VSRQHARLSSHNHNWFLTDLGSRAGTFLNGVRLDPDGPVATEPGDLVRIGPYTFRLERGEPDDRTLVPRDMALAPGSVMARATTQELDALAVQRLQLLMDGAAAIQKANGEADLARESIELSIAGTGFQRAMFLRHTGPKEPPEVVAFKDSTESPEAFAYSHTMVREAERGHVVRLLGGLDASDGQSIGMLGIHCAVCCPITFDNSVVGYLYLDCRETEPTCFPDAVGFSHAVASLAGLSLANQKRAQLQVRQAQLEKDLAAARQAQSFLLPTAEGVVGHVRYVSQTHPGRFVAGDLFDIFPVSDTRVGVCFGDVCGQGVGAAILMIAILSHVRAAMKLNGDPVVAVTEANRYILERSSHETFATLLVGVFDRTQGTFQYVDAGHGHWVTHREGAAPQPAALPEGLVIGVDSGFQYTLQRIECGRGDRVVLYSDGVVEHTDSEGEEFGQRRLVEAMTGSENAADDVTRAMTTLREYIGQGGLKDDTTIASIEIHAD
jgi:serine phosphatase RsbU (regulator of sigma subunit)/pSer/pThr/pTyr-binding forkhead associated (FHA) protein